MFTTTLPQKLKRQLQYAYKAKELKALHLCQKFSLSQLKQLSVFFTISSRILPLFWLPLLAARSASIAQPHLKLRRQCNLVPQKYHCIQKYQHYHKLNQHHNLLLKTPFGAICVFFLGGGIHFPYYVPLTTDGQFGFLCSFLKCNCLYPTLMHDDRYLGKLPRFIGTGPFTLS